MFNYWLVKLGKMFYGGGLHRNSDIEKSFSYEFVRDEEVAFLFVDRKTAERIADKCGGTVFKKEIKQPEEYSRLEKKKSNYEKSEEV